MTGSVASMVMFVVHESFYDYQWSEFGLLPGQLFAMANTEALKSHRWLLDAEGRAEMVQTQSPRTVRMRGDSNTKSPNCLQAGSCYQCTMKFATAL